MLAKCYRITAYNSTTQTLAAHGLVMTGRRWKYNSGDLAYESSEAALIDNSSGLTNASYLSTSTIDNSSTLYFGGDFKVTVIAPASSVGSVVIYYEVSTDGGSTWPTAGRGYIAKTIAVPSAGTYSENFRL